MLAVVKDVGWVMGDGVVMTNAEMSSRFATGGSSLQGMQSDKASLRTVMRVVFRWNKFMIWSEVSRLSRMKENGLGKYF